MKRIFLALLAVVAMVACEKENKNIEKENLSMQSKYEFYFDENGICYCKDNEGITPKEFAEKIVGYGWELSNIQPIQNDGSLYEYQDPYPTKDEYIYMFVTSEGNVTILETTLEKYHKTDSYDISYENSVIYLNEKTNYRILEVTDSTLALIETKDMSHLDESNCYCLHEYKRLTDEQIAKITESYKPKVSKYEFAFDENGVCYSKTYEGITQEEFDSKVMGYGWKEASSNRVLQSGEVLQDRYYFEVLGVGPEHLYFEKEGAATIFYHTGAYDPANDNFVGERAYTYENSGLYNDWCKPSYYYMILEVSEDELVLLMCRDRARESNDWTYTYTLNCYNRMTPEQLEEYQQTYTRKWGEE